MANFLRRILSNLPPVVSSPAFRVPGFSDDYPFPLVVHEMVADFYENPQVRKCLITFIKRVYFCNDENFLVFIQKGGTVKILLVLPLFMDYPQECFMLFIRKVVRFISGISVKLVNGGFEKCD